MEVAGTEIDCTGTYTVYKCKNCDETKRELLSATSTGHHWDTQWHSNAGGHWHICTVCGATGEWAMHTSSDHERCDVCHTSVLSVGIVGDTCVHGTLTFEEASLTEWLNKVKKENNNIAIAPVFSWAVADDALGKVNAHPIANAVEASLKLSEFGGKYVVMQVVAYGIQFMQPVATVNSGYIYVNPETHIPYQAATCAKTGLQEHKYCSVCGKRWDMSGNEKTLEQLTIAKNNDHIWSNDCDTTCNRCGATRKTSHVWSNWIADEDAHYRKCTKCGLKDGFQSHSSTQTDMKNPGCTENGYIKFTCDVCGHKVNTTLPATGHLLNHVNAVPGDCMHEGSIEFWYCDYCAFNFADSNGKTKVDSTIGKKDPNNHVGGPLAYDKDNHWNVCECGALINKMEHTYSVDGKCIACGADKPAQESIATPTPVPTIAPGEPTSAPVEPTAAPVEPTNAPEDPTPTVAPTPTEAGNADPTVAPTDAPAATPTSAPTDKPGSSETGKKNLTWLWILLAILVLAGGGAGYYFFVYKKKANKAE